MESGLRRLPEGFAADGPMPAVAMVPVSGGGGRTPWAIKLAAVGGIVSTLTGLTILIYFLAFDRPDKRPQPPAAAAQTPAMVPTPAPRAVEPDAAPVAIEFPPMEVERTPERATKAARSAKPTKSRSAQGTATTKKMTAEQKRLMALYGKDKGADVPTVGRTARSRGPRRPLSANDVVKLQRTNSRGLKACYERALKRDTTLSSIRVDVEIDLGDTGVVRSVKLSGTDSAFLVDCLRRNIKRWVFPPVGAQPVAFPLIFRGS